MKQTLSKLLIVLGSFFFVVFLYLLYLKFSPNPITFEFKTSTPPPLNNESPQRLKIPAIKVDAAIFPALIRNNQWETTGKGVSYLISSPLPGQSGNSVMYGHNWASILGNLPKIKPGQRIFIEWKDGRKKEFEVRYTAIVEPGQKEIIEWTNDTRLTIYTCVGFMDSKRFVVVAVPVS